MSPHLCYPGKITFTGHKHARDEVRHIAVDELLRKEEVEKKEEEEEEEEEETQDYTCTYILDSPCCDVEAYKYFSCTIKRCLV